MMLRLTQRRVVLASSALVVLSSALILVYKVHHR
jgi:hypothetical protein